LCFTLLRMRQWRVRLLTVLIVGGVTSAIAACTSSSGGDPTLSPGPPSTSTRASTSPSGTPTPTGPATTRPNVRPGEDPPVLIPEAKEHNSTGALFFAQYYMRAKDWSLATMDTFFLRQISLPSCSSCKEWEGAIEKYVRQRAYA